MSSPEPLPRSPNGGAHGDPNGGDSAELEATAEWFRQRPEFARTINGIIAAVGCAKPQNHVEFIVQHLRTMLPDGHPLRAPPTADTAPQGSAVTAARFDRERPSALAQTPRGPSGQRATIAQGANDSPLGAAQHTHDREDSEYHGLGQSVAQYDMISDNSVCFIGAPAAVRAYRPQSTDCPWRTKEQETHLKEVAMVRQRRSFASGLGGLGMQDGSAPETPFEERTCPDTNTIRAKSKLAQWMRVGDSSPMPRRMPTCNIRAMKAYQPKTKLGIRAEGCAARATFIAQKWMPFVKRAHALRDLARERAASEINIVDRIPVDNFEIHDMLCECMYLTAQWYGRSKGNISFMYDWFTSTCEAAGISRYAFDQIRTQWSRDKHVLMVDSTRRGEILAKVREMSKIEALAGEWTQQQGVSAIDNTLLNNIFTPDEATHLLAGEICHRFIVMLLHHAQLRALRIIGRHCQIDLVNEEDPDVIKGVLDKIDDRELTSWGITPTNVSYLALRQRGRRVWNWGQLPPEGRVVMHKHITASIARRTRKLASDDPFLKFVEHAKSHPGEYYGGERQGHMVMLFAGVICRKIVVVTRSEMERHTKAKYLAIQWQRKCDLKDTNQKIVRPAATQEHMRIRINEAGYAPSHGMSLSGSGVVENADAVFDAIRHSHGRKGINPDTIDERFEVALAREMNLPRDPGARLANWFLVDIEKILHEVRLLNPPGEFRTEHLLPFEGFYEVGQNPKIGSSIAATQHTQMSRGSLSTWPIYQLEQRPTYFEELRATLDIVTIGWQQDSVVLKVKTQEPVYKGLVQFLIDLKSYLMENSHGGACEIDFNVKALMDDIDGGFVIIFAPLMQLEKGAGGSADAGLKNPDTGEADDGTLPVCKIDTGKGEGLWMLSAEKDHEKWRKAIENGEEYLRKLYDFCRKPGVKALMTQFIRDRFGKAP
eukprot:TRINITY_DN11590_c0_g1_i2.p1 TRINITY_DN11590_c0_g1~~TRINITY_DN11590_c0_g1_i2.p1  ORF type:complete len:939 (+),score=313.14 TRINITY_DN11590_c0_g1_i2:128-2944(+)